MTTRSRHKMADGGGNVDAVDNNAGAGSGNYVTRDCDDDDVTRDQLWWGEVRRGVRRHYEKQLIEKNMRQRCMLVFVAMLCWLAFSTSGSSFWREVFGTVVLSKCLLGDGYMFGNPERQVPRWARRRRVCRNNDYD